MEPIEQEYNKAIEYLSKRYSVRVQYDYIAKPNNKNTQDKLCKVSNGEQDIMWVYLKLGRKLYASIETEPEYVKEIRENLHGFDEIKERDTKPRLKLIFTDFSAVEESTKDILDSIDEYTGISTSAKVDSINVPMLPKKITEDKNNYIVTCGRCEEDFIKARRCTSCGQMLKWPDDDEFSKYLVRVEGNKRKLDDIYDWAKVTSFTSIDRKKAIEITEYFEQEVFSYRVGTSDITAYFKNDNHCVALMLYASGRSCGIQPSEIYRYGKNHNIDEKYIEEFLEGMKKFLSPSQNHKPYEDVKGYYFIFNETIYENLKEIAELYKALLEKAEG